MPPACTRNRAAVYGLPWLAAGAAGATALAAGVARAETLAGWVLLGSILALGLPHGAADWWVMRSLAAGRGGFGRLVAGYILAALATFALWGWQPGGSLAGFLFLTAWHFGSADASVLLPDRAPWRDPAWWLFATGRGLLVVFAPLAFWPAQAAAVLMPFTALGGDVETVLADLLRAAPGLLWLGAGLQTAGLGLEIRARFLCRDQRTLACEGLETGVLLLLFRAAPPLLAFACYWIAFHAWRHLLRVESILHPDRTDLPLWRAVVDFHRRTLPLTLCSLSGLGVVFVLWPGLRQGSAHAVAAYLILLSALTVPHAVIIGWLDAKAEG